MGFFACNNCQRLEEELSTKIKEHRFAEEQLQESRTFNKYLHDRLIRYQNDSTAQTLKHLEKEDLSARQIENLKNEIAKLKHPTTDDDFDAFRDIINISDAKKVESDMNDLFVYMMKYDGRHIPDQQLKHFKKRVKHFLAIRQEMWRQGDNHALKYLGKQYSKFEEQLDHCERRLRWL